MRIDLSNPDAVWQAANPILTQPNAVAIFAKALDLLPMQELPSAQLHRIRLSLCHGLALFSVNQIEPSLAVLRAALYRAAQQPLPTPQAQPPFIGDTESGLALPLLARCLAWCARAGCCPTTKTLTWWCLCSNFKPLSMPCHLWVGNLRG
jgi:hypothetical protein